MRVKIDLRALDPAGGEFEADHDIGLTDPTGQPLTVRALVAVAYRSTGASWFFRATVTGRLETVCHRCLEPASTEVTGRFELAVRRGGTGVEPQPGEEYLVLGVGEHDISLDERIHEAFIVNVPIRIVCSDSCRGLCVQCGANLNQETCTCRPSGDPRWDALKRLQNDGGRD